MTTRFFVRPLTALLFMVALFALVACGADTTTTDSPTSVVVATAASNPTSAPEPTEAPAEATTAPIADATVAPTEAADPTEVVTATEPATTPTTEPTAEPAPVVLSCTKFNLNDVTGDQLLATIPDFSSRMVREFEEYRPYVSIQQFRREIGKYVDEATVAGYEQYVFVPVDPNGSDAATLMQLPGVTEAIATELTNARPYDSPDAFLATLSTLVTAEEAAQASCYIVAGA